MLKTTNINVFEQLSSGDGVISILKRNLLFILITCLFAAVIYVNGLNADFVSDDYASITQNDQISNFWFMNHDVSLVSSSTWLIAALFGTTSPVPYHAFSVFIYIVVIILAFIFCSLYFNDTISRLSTIIFAVLPIHVEAVTWISGKPYLYNALTMLVCMIMFSLWLKHGKKKYFWLFLATIPLAYIGDKIRFFALPLILGLIYVSFSQKVIKINLLKMFSIFAVVLVVLFFVLLPKIQYRIFSVNGGGNIADYFYNPVYQYPTAINKYLQLMLLPFDLTLYHTFYATQAWLNWLVFLSYLGLVVWSFRKNKYVFFALSFIFIAMSPSISPVKVSWLVAERYVFLGSLGFSLFLAIILEKFATGKFKYISYGVLLCLVGLYSLRVYSRNVDWQTNHNLWVNTCYVSPNSHNAWNNIGDDYDKLKDYPNAIKGFTQSTVVKPDYADAFHNRGNILFKIGRFDLARESYSIALKLNPGLYQSRFSMIQIALTQQEYEQAVTDAFELVKQRPEDAMAHYAMGFSLAKAGRLKEAQLALRRSIEINPNFPMARGLLDSIVSDK